MKTNDSELFVNFLRTNDVWLMERILHYAHLYDYTKYTSTLVSAWRLSIVGLNDSVEGLLLQNLESIELNPDDNY